MIVSDTLAWCLCAVVVLTVLVGCAQGFAWCVAALSGVM